MKVRFKKNTVFNGRLYEAGKEYNLKKEEVEALGERVEVLEKGKGEEAKKNKQIQEAKNK